MVIRLFELGGLVECVSRLSPLILPLATLYYLSRFLQLVIRYRQQLHYNLPAIESGYGIS